MSLWDSTPARSLFPHIPSALLGIAPERRSELELRASDITFELNDDFPLGFSSTHRDSRIFVSRRGVEYLWALSYFAWILHARYVPNTAIPQELVFADHPDTAALPLLLGWAFYNQCNDTYAAWPSVLPHPHDLADGDPLNPTVERVASELALCAAGWILHHELAHIAHRDTPDSPASLQEEMRADKEATDWLLAHSPLGTPLQKRGLGIVVGSVALAGAELFGPPPTSSRRTHPEAAFRIFTTLDHPTLAANDEIHVIASLLLKALLDRARVSTSVGPFASGKEALSQHCSELQEALRARVPGRAI